MWQHFSLNYYQTERSSSTPSVGSKLRNIGSNSVDSRRRQRRSHPSHQLRRFDLRNFEIESHKTSAAQKDEPLKLVLPQQSRKRARHLLQSFVQPHHEVVERFESGWGRQERDCWTDLRRNSVGGCDGGSIKRLLVFQCRKASSSCS
jgi:hypothetical protein